MIADGLDRVLDWTVLPGYSSLGYRLRERGWPDAGNPVALEGRAVLVTGANSGLGEATCAMLAAGGASVHMVSRDAGRGERARERIRGRVSRGELHLWQADLSDPGSVSALADGVRARVPALDGLVNNAGVLAEKRTHTPDGVELTFATNVLGPHLLTNLLLESLRASRDARVVNVSSGGMYTSRLQADDLQLAGRDFDGAAFYAHTKRISVILTELCQARLGGPSLSFHSMHPGWVDTPGLAASLPRFHRLLKPVLRDTRQGADTIAWLLGAAPPLGEPGLFWHDRRPRSTHRVPWTRESGADRAALWEGVSELCEARATAGALSRAR